MWDDEFSLKKIIKLSLILIIIPTSCLFGPILSRQDAVEVCQEHLGVKLVEPTVTYEGNIIKVEGEDYYCIFEEE